MNNAAENTATVTHRYECKGCECMIQEPGLCDLCTEVKSDLSPKVPGLSKYVYWYSHASGRVFKAGCKRVCELNGWTILEWRGGGRHGRVDILVRKPDGMILRIVERNAGGCAVYVLGTIECGRFVRHEKCRPYSVDEYRAARRARVAAAIGRAACC